MTLLYHPGTQALHPQLCIERFFAVCVLTAYEASGTFAFAPIMQRICRDIGGCQHKRYAVQHTRPGMNLAIGCLLPPILCVWLSTMTYMPRALCERGLTQKVYSTTLIQHGLIGCVQQKVKNQSLFPISLVKRVAAVSTPISCPIAANFCLKCGL